MSAGLAALVAIVVHDHALMRAAPEPDAPEQATLWRGEWLEVRGQARDYVQVYDRRRERPGYVARWLVRTYELGPASAPALRAVVDFVRDMPGAESLGVGYVSLFLRAAPPDAIDPALFDALGAMAQRLAERASTDGGSADGRAVPHHLDVAESYGVHFRAIEVAQAQAALDGPATTRLCYDGEAFRMVLRLDGSSAEARAHAALALTDPQCVPPGLRPDQLRDIRATFADWLSAIDPNSVAADVGNQLRLRSAELQAKRAFDLARRGLWDKARAAQQSARASWLAVDRAALQTRDAFAYHRAAIAVTSAGWAGVTAADNAATGRLRLAASAGAEPGQTCVQLLGDAGNGPEARRCTHGLVWMASARAAPNAQAFAVSVQPLESWLELWVFHQTGDGWRVDVLVPTVGSGDVDSGYVELAGFSPGGDRLLVAREAMVDARRRQWFEALAVDSLEVREQATSLRRAPWFRRHAAADWRERTLAGD